MKIIITEQVYKEICKKIKLKKTYRTYKKTLEEYYKSIYKNKDDFHTYVINMMGYNS